MKKENVLLSARHMVIKINQMTPEERRETILKVEHELRNLLFGEEDKLEGFIFSTKDLTQFKDMKGNRIINENSKAIKDLADSIEKSQGNVSPVAINEKMEKVDGQRRITAMRKYGLPYRLTYFFKRDADIDTVGEINKNQNKWNHKDWLHKHIEFEKPYYVQYQDIASKHEIYMRSRSLRGLLMNGRVDPLPTNVWENGDFKIDQEHLEMNLRFLAILAKVHLIGDKDNVFASDRNFQKALFEIYKKTKKFNEERLLVKLRTHFGRVNIKTDYKTYKTILGELYNSRLRSDLNHAVVKEPETAETGK